MCALDGIDGLVGRHGQPPAEGHHHLLCVQYSHFANKVTDYPFYTQTLNATFATAQSPFRQRAMAGALRGYIFNGYARIAHHFPFLVLPFGVGAFALVLLLVAGCSLLCINLSCLASPGHCPSRDVPPTPRLQQRPSFDVNADHYTPPREKRNRLRNLRVGEEVRCVAGEQGGAPVPGGEGGRGASLNRAHDPLTVRAPFLINRIPFRVNRVIGVCLRFGGRSGTGGSALILHGRPDCKHARSSIQFTPPGAEHKYK